MSYWDFGEYRLKHGVLESIAGISLLGVRGVRGLGMRHGLGEERLKRKNVTKGIRAQFENGKVTLELQVCVDYGSEFLQVATNVQKAVKEAVEKMTGKPVESVGVDIVGVNAP